ncbi:uncharacterized protein TNCV_1285771 [Trichonephila clavipes]|uniref:Uncharacterized protein n=1 Tax=Trichonephila clavipes TaxID=2585209 RepID=A0A8X6SLF4_TRICX|nr:uncharacterized protein TNCV_1285771 [Trichonephila clavipes]
MTGLRNSCPRDILLYEADLQFLSLQSRYLLAKYFAKFISYADQYKTSSHGCNCNHNRHLKRGIPFSYAESKEWLHNEVEYVSLACCMDVAASFYERIFVKTEFSSYTNKGAQHPQYLRQLALETSHKIQSKVLQICSDDSMDVGAVSGRGPFIKKGKDIRICERNPDCTLLTLSGRTLSYGGGFEILLY